MIMVFYTNTNDELKGSTDMSKVVDAYSWYGSRNVKLDMVVFPENPTIDDIICGLAKNCIVGVNLIRSNIDAVNEFNIPNRTMYHTDDWSVCVVYE
jgi:hypothetical protein